jgi:hypothetical protein
MRDKVNQILPYLFLVFMILWVTVEAVRFQGFMKQGPRFTAYDGQELCERVKRLESVSYGFRDSSFPQLDCQYSKREQK